MIICLNCGNDNMQIKHKSIVDPSKDLFTCESCGNTQLRYSGTKYETPQELRKRLKANAT
jgi:transposase-like protein